MTELTSPMDAMVNDLSIHVMRNGGTWKCVIEGCPLPRDVHRVQKLISDVYRGHRKKIARNFHQSKQKFKTMVTETKIAERRLRTAKAAYEPKEETNETKKGVTDVKSNESN